MDGSGQYEDAGASRELDRNVGDSTMDDAPQEGGVEWDSLEKGEAAPSAPWPLNASVRPPPHLHSLSPLNRLVRL